MMTMIGGILTGKAKTNKVLDSQTREGEVGVIFLFIQALHRCKNFVFENLERYLF